LLRKTYTRARAHATLANAARRAIALPPPPLPRGQRRASRLASAAPAARQVGLPAPLP
jgi:hypothetical protein